MWNDYKRLYGMTEDEYEMLNEKDVIEDDDEEEEYGSFMKNFYGYSSYWEEPVVDKETEEEKILLGFFGDFGVF